jgi:hypothetical protein
MVALAKRVLSIEPTESDQALLDRALAKINSERFNNQLTITARWAIPSAVEPRDLSQELNALPHEEQLRVADAMQAYAERDFARARDLIKPLCRYELRPIIGLYTSALRHLKEDIWFNTSQSVWVNDPDSIAPAVASIEVKDDLEQILVHPSLSSIGLKAPRYVINYVLYHECIHKALNTTAYNPHPPLFRRLESLADRREDAIAWLRKHKFATIEDVVV